MTGTLPVVLASLPRVCEVCRGEERMLAIRPGAPLGRSVVVPCPHCQGWPLVDLLSLLVGAS